MKKVPCENSRDALKIAKSIANTIESWLQPTPDELRNIVRKANGLAKWSREELSKILLASMREP